MRWIVLEREDAGFTRASVKMKHRILNGWAICLELENAMRTTCNTLHPVSYCVEKIGPEDFRGASRGNKKYTLQQWIGYLSCKRMIIPQQRGSWSEQRENPQKRSGSG